MAENQRGGLDKVAKKIISVIVIVLLIAFICTSLFLVNQKPDISHITNAQRVAEYTKPAVVRIVDGAIIKWSYEPIYSGDYQIDAIIKGVLEKMNYESDILFSGSGAIISPDGYIVTNAHVVQTSKTEDAKIVQDEFSRINLILAEEFGVSYDIMYDYLVERLKYESVAKVLKVILPGGEFVDGEIKSYGAPVGEGKDVAVLKIEKKNLPCIRLGDSDKVTLQESIWVFGYPSAADSNLLSNDSILVVSITDGKISATDKKSAQGAPVLQINAAATHGNSGGPVVKEDGSIVGLLTFKSEENTKDIQGFNFVVPVNTVSEFVNQAGSKNDGGEVDRLYREGLNLYWGGYYKDALTNFEAIERLNATHSEVKKFISECQQKIPQSKILWSKYKAICIVLDGLAGVIILLLIFFVFVWRKMGDKAAAPKESPQPAEIPAEPIRPAPPTTQTHINAPAPPAHMPPNGAKAKLCAITGSIKGMDVEVSDEAIILGRDPRLCTMVFPQESIEIGRRHCGVSYDSETKLFVIEDYGSTGGTFLGSGEQLNPNEKYHLKSGDSFYLVSEDNLFEVWLD